MSECPYACPSLVTYEEPSPDAPRSPRERHGPDDDDSDSGDSVQTTSWFRTQLAEEERQKQEKERQEEADKLSARLMSQYFENEGEEKRCKEEFTEMMNAHLGAVFELRKKEADAEERGEPSVRKVTWKDPDTDSVDWDDSSSEADSNWDRVFVGSLPLLLPDDVRGSDSEGEGAAAAPEGARGSGEPPAEAEESIGPPPTAEDHPLMKNVNVDGGGAPWRHGRRILDLDAAKWNESKKIGRAHV